MVLNIYVTSVSIRQQDRGILRLTNNPYTKVLNSYVTSVSIRQHNRHILRLRNRSSTNVSNVSIRQRNRLILRLTNNPYIHIYSCNQCDYQTKTRRYLKRHKQAIREILQYSCNQCGYQATQLLHLRLPNKRKHSPLLIKCVMITVIKLFEIKLWH